MVGIEPICNTAIPNWWPYLTHKVCDGCFTQGFDPHRRQSSVSINNQFLMCLKMKTFVSKNERVRSRLKSVVREEMGHWLYLQKFKSTHFVHIWKICHDVLLACDAVYMMYTPQELYLSMKPISPFAFDRWSFWFLPAWWVGLSSLVDDPRSRTLVTQGRK